MYYEYVDNNYILPRETTWGITTFIHSSSRVWAVVCSLREIVLIPTILCVLYESLIKVFFVYEQTILLTNLPPRQARNCGVIGIGS